MTTFEKQRLRKCYKKYPVSDILEFYQKCQLSHFTYNEDNMKDGINIATGKSGLRHMIYFVIYILVCVIISLMSFRKRISFWGVLVISIFLTPVVGLISVIKADNNVIIYHYSMSNTCNSCNAEINTSETNCPVCGNTVNLITDNQTKINLA